MKAELYEMYYTQSTLESHNISITNTQYESRTLESHTMMAVLYEMCYIKQV